MDHIGGFMFYQWMVLIPTCCCAWFLWGSPAHTLACWDRPDADPRCIFHRFAGLLQRHKPCHGSTWGLWMLVKVSKWTECTEEVFLFGGVLQQHLMMIIDDQFKLDLQVFIAASCLYLVYLGPALRSPRLCKSRYMWIHLDTFGVIIPLTTLRI